MKMQKGILKAVIAFAVALTVILSGTAMSANFNENTNDGEFGSLGDITRVSIQPSTMNVEQGERFEVSIYIEPSKPISEIFMGYLYFDASLLYVNHLELDNFFDPYDTMCPIWPEVDNVNGYIKDFYEFIMGLGSVTSNGSWLTINFTAKNMDGVSLLEIDNVWIFNEYMEFVPTITNNGSVTIGENTPEISNVVLIASEPLDTSLPGDPPCFSGGWENVSCTVTDADEVKLIVTYPIEEEYPMINIVGTDKYYVNITLTEDGCYTYHVWADNIYDNENTSSSQLFELPPNEDVDMNGQIQFMDLVAIVLRYSEYGPRCGWVREDVDNNGHVHFMDLVAIVLHYGEYWDQC